MWERERRSPAIFSEGRPVFSTSATRKTDRHDYPRLLLHLLYQSIMESTKFLKTFGFIVLFFPKEIGKTWEIFIIMLYAIKFLRKHKVVIRDKNCVFCENMKKKIYKLFQHDLNSEAGARGALFNVWTSVSRTNDEIIKVHLFILTFIQSEEKKLFWNSQK